jgi:hypothetical protein
MAGNTPGHLELCCSRRSFVNSKIMPLITLLLFYERHFNKKSITVARIFVSKTKEVLGAQENACMRKHD